MHFFGRRSTSTETNFDRWVQLVSDIRYTALTMNAFPSPLDLPREVTLYIRDLLDRRAARTLFGAARWYIRRATIRRYVTRASITSIGAQRIAHSRCSTTTRRRDRQTRAWVRSRQCGPTRHFASHDAAGRPPLYHERTLQVTVAWPTRSADITRYDRTVETRTTPPEKHTFHSDRGWRARDAQPKSTKYKRLTKDD